MFFYNKKKYRKFLLIMYSLTKISLKRQQKTKSSVIISSNYPVSSFSKKIVSFDK